MKRTSLIIYLAVAVMLGFVLGHFIFPSKKSEAVVSHGQHTGSENQQIWTCSMHPQIRQNEPGLCPICEMDLVPLQTTGNTDPLKLEMTPESAKLANIQTFVVGQEDIPGNSIRLSGIVKPDERRTSSVVTHVPGRIENLYISFVGQHVDKGQRVATIYSPDLISAQRELLEAAKMGETGAFLLAAAKNKFKYWKIQEAVVLSILERGEIQETFDVYAASSGVVTNKRHSVGDYLKQGEALLEVVDLNALWVVFEAYESDLASIKLGQSISFTTPSLGTTQIQGKISFIDPILDASARTVSVRVEAKNTKGQLKPGMLVTGTILSKNMNQQITIPRSAVLWTGQRSVVYVKMPDTEIPIFEYREVKLGQATDSGYEITSGLEMGDEIVVNGTFAIDAAAQLSNKSSMMNQVISVKVDQLDNTIPTFQKVTPSLFKSQIDEMTMAYLKIKDELVASDLLKSQEFVVQMLETIERVDMNLVKGEAHMYWMEKSIEMRSSLKAFKIASEIEPARKQFQLLTEPFIEVLKAFHDQNKLLFVQFCPMAFDDNGANWISREKEVRNPYFGDRMLKCGSVIDSL